MPAALACLLIAAGLLLGCTRSGSESNRSTGCDPDERVALERTAPDGTGGQVVTISTPDGERSWFQRTPAAAGSSDPRPLVIDFHGYTEGAPLHRTVSGFEALGEEEGFVTVTPQGQGTPTHWDARLDSPDLDFVGDLLDTVEGSTCIDLDQVYVTGFSNGAFMSSSVACRYADRVAAIGAVAGLRDVPDCDPARPVPVIAFHGTDDQFVRYDGGLGPDAEDLPAPDGSGKTLGEDPAAIGTLAPGSIDDAVPDVAEAWADRNGCTAGSDEAAESSDTTRVSFTCPAGAAVELYRTEGGGHGWPGSLGSAMAGEVVGPTTFTIDATELTWQFFQDHPRS